MAQVNDYNIANASGASVRSDLNAVFIAIKTLNSGASVPSNTDPFMPYVDTADNNNLKIRNSANNGFTTIGPVNTANLGLLPRAGGTMTGVLALASQNTEQLFLDQNGITLNLQNEIRFGDANSSHYAAIKAPSTISSNFTLTLPTNDGNNGQFLQTNGSGVLSFATVTTFSGAASALTGNTLASGVTNSSLTSVGTLGSLTVSGNITANGNINGDGNTDLNNIDDANIDRGIFNNVESSNYKSRNSSPPVFKNSSNSETAAGRLVRMSVNFDSFRGGSATDNFTSIRRSFNVSSITDHGEGQFSVNFSTSLPSGSTTAGIIDIDRFTNNNHCTLYLENTTGAGTGSVRVRICSATNSGHVFDKNSVNVVCFA